MRRVLWVIKGLGPGGAERLLLAAASTHDPDRFRLECTFVVPNKDHLCDALERSGVRTHCLSESTADPRWPLRLARLIRETRWDVVHVHSPLPGSIARLAVRSVPASVRPALITTEHNAWHTFRAPTRLLNRATIGLDDITFAVSDEVRRSMSHPDRVKVLHHGIDVTTTAAAIMHRQRIRDELGVTDDHILVGTVANYREQKDYPNLLQAVRRLVDAEVPFTLVAVGQGPDEHAVHALRDELDLADHVVLTGFRDDPVSVLAACDVFVLASQWEGLPVALMEALALGLPIVATDVGGVGEVLTDDVDALLVPPRDPCALARALQCSITSGSLRARLGEASRMNADRFDVRRTVGRLEHAYATVAPHVPADGSQLKPNPTRGEESAVRGARSVGVEIRPAMFEDREQILQLGRAALGWGEDDRYRQLFSWKHDDNVFGPSYMWVAVDAGRVVGLRAFMRWQFVRGGETLRAVRAVDTATHPDYQGRGLFTALTLHGLDELHADGVDFVFNTPNSASRPGYLKLGWEVVGRLPVAIRPNGVRGSIEMARSRRGASLWPTAMLTGTSIDAAVERLASARSDPADVRLLATDRTEQFLRWRYGPEFLGYRVIEDGSSAAIVRMRHRGRGRELVVLDTFGDSSVADPLVASVARSERATHSLRTGPGDVRSGFVAVPATGPILTWRSVNLRARPPRPNWALAMGDVELF